MPEPRAAGRPSRRPTRRDVARAAGVSDAVVSYTLNGGAPVAAATAERVRAAAAQLGYTPNLAARALKSGSTRTLALVGPGGDARVFTNPFFTEFAAAVEDAARRRGYAVLSSSAGATGGEMLTRIRDLWARQVDGVLVVPGDQLDPADLEGGGVPWVQLNTPRPVTGVRSVGVDLRSGAIAAVEHLASHGHRGVAFVGVTPDTEAAELRFVGWREACARLGLEDAPAIDSPFTREGGYAAGRRIAEERDRPTAVFAASDLIALGLLRALHEAGVRIPDDVAVVSFDGSWESEYSWPALTSLRQPIEEMAEASVASLLEETPPSHREFPGTLVLRASCGEHPAVTPPLG